MAPAPDRFTIDLTGVTLMGHFRVEGKMAAGGMGSVWKAINLSLKKPVVVKVPDQALLGREGFRARFQLEIEQLVKFNHPNVVSILAAGEHEGVPFFVLDYLEGGSLKDHLAKAGGRQGANEVLAWLKPIAAALDVLHENDVIHRDVKPGNILFHKFGQPYLSDFGIAKVLSGGAAGLTTTGGALFTAAYAAPEQMADDVGGAQISGAADQYALASTVYEALGGRPPFEGSTSQIIAGKLTSEPPDLGALAAHVPAAGCIAVAKALSRRAPDRFATCTAFATAFEAGLAPNAGAAATAERTRRAAAQAPPEISEPQRRSRALPLLALLALVGGGGFFGLKALGVVGGGRGGERADAAPGPVTPAAPVASPAPPTKPPEAPATPPEPPPTLPPAYEAPLARAKAAMAEGDGAKAKTALAEAVAADAPKRLTAEVEEFVSAWEAAPVLAINAPTSDAEIEAGTDGRWQIAVKGTLQTARKGDRLFLEDREIARDAAGAFSFTTARSAAGPVTLTLEVRDGTTLRASRSASVRLKVNAPPAPPTPPKPSLPTWATPLLSQAQKDEAQRLTLPAAFEEPTTGMRFVLIPGGAFTMGSADSEADRSADEGPQRRVTVPPFYLSIHETTNAQFLRFQASQKGQFGGDARPVETVSHDEATAFAAWLSQQGSGATKGGYRLPSEAEWEYACRAGTTTRFEPGDAEADLARAGWYLANSGTATHTVGEKPANPWGLHDMHGNVWEWCEDDYHSTYEGAPTDGSAWIDSPRARERVERGGSWFNSLRALRSAVRRWDRPSFSIGILGFRVARSVTAVTSVGGGEPPSDAPSAPPAAPAGPTPATPAPGPAAPAVPSWVKVSPEQHAEAKRLGIDVAFEEPTTGVRFVLIPGGAFRMGSAASEEGRFSDEGPQHRVTVPAFYLSIHETTNAQFLRFQAGHKGKFEGDTRPVETVSHEEATAFAAWLSKQGTGATKGGYRLPSEAEWEYACRAGTTTRFWSGDAEADLARVGWYDANSGSTTHPVGEMPANPWGLHDVHGNVWEWCADDGHSSYEGAPSDGSAGIDSPRAVDRVVRGGAWFNPLKDLRSASRGGYEPTHRHGHLGFRLARAVTAR